MNRFLLTSLVTTAILSFVPMAEAKHRRHHDRDDDDWKHHHRYGKSRVIYVVENRRPVRRVVYGGPGGGYYRVVDGRRAYVRGRYYTSYPSRYYYSDGRPRVGVSINF